MNDQAVVYRSQTERAIDQFMYNFLWNEGGIIYVALGAVIALAVIGTFTL